MFLGFNYNNLKTYKMKLLTAIIFLMMIFQFDLLDKMNIAHVCPLIFS